MTDKEKKELQNPEKEEEKKQTISETWAHDIIEDLDDWIESQGIYLRQ